LISRAYQASKLDIKRNKASKLDIKREALHPLISRVQNKGNSKGISLAGTQASNARLSRLSRLSKGGKVYPPPNFQLLGVATSISKIKVPPHIKDK
jgi:hypothetical protein